MTDTARKKINLKMVNRNVKGQTISCQFAKMCSYTYNPFYNGFFFFKWLEVESQRLN